MAKPRTKKKEKKNIVSGIAHVNSTFNNTLVTISDDQGNVVTEQVKDGTFTYYDLWPNDPVGNTEMQDDVKADYSKGIQIGSLNDLKYDIAN